jgi:hypothetical protein
MPVANKQASKQGRSPKLAHFLIANGAFNERHRHGDSVIIADASFRGANNTRVVAEGTLLHWDGNDRLQPDLIDGDLVGELGLPLLPCRPGGGEGCFVEVELFYAFQGRPSGLNTVTIWPKVASGLKRVDGTQFSFGPRLQKYLVNQISEQKMLASLQSDLSGEFKQSPSSVFYGQAIGR